MDLIALSLHKSYHHLQQHDEIRDDLHRLTNRLDEVLDKLIETPTPQRDRLTKLSKQYLEFAKLASQVTELQNTVTINTENYRQITNELKLLPLK